MKTDEKTVMDLAVKILKAIDKTDAVTAMNALYRAMEIVDAGVNGKREKA